MKGLKVYLKASVTKVYLYSQGVVGACLLANVLREYDQFDQLQVPLIANVIVGLMLILNVVMPRKFQRKLRYLPGLLLLLGGGALVYITTVSIGVRYFHLNKLFLLAGYAFAAWGLAQPLLDVNRVIYFSPEGLRLRMSIFGARQYRWTEVAAVVFQDKGFIIECSDGKTFKLHPYEGDSQNMRVRIDKLMTAAKKLANSATEPSPSELLHPERGSMA